jgi:hypothetical protein
MVSVVDSHQKDQVLAQTMPGVGRPRCEAGLGLEE